MGSCSFCEGNADSMQQVTPDTVPYRRTASTKEKEPGSVPSADESADFDYGHLNVDSEGMNEDSEPSKSIQTKIIEEFHNAVKIGNDSMITFYIQEYPSMNLINTKYNNNTPLHVAVMNKQYKLLQYLLDNKASPNPQNDENGDTPLHIAVRIGDKKLVQILLKYEVDVNIKNKDEDFPTALSIALEEEYDDIANYLEPDKHKLSELTKAANSAKYFSDDGAPRMSTQRVNDFAADILSISPQHSAPSNFELNTMNTTRLNSISDDIWDDIQQDVIKKASTMIGVEGWLDKKQQSPPYSWLKRWVVVKDRYLLWSDRQMTINEGVDEKEMKRWNKCVDLGKISISIIEGTKKERKFKVNVGRRNYIWRAKTKEMRDYWIKTLNEHMDHCKATELYSPSISVVSD